MNVKIKSTRKKLPPKRLQAAYKRDFQNVLRKIGAKGVSNIRNELKARNLIDTGDTKKSITYNMTPQGVKFIAEGAAPYLEKGVRKHQMKYLMNSSKPIPVDVMNAVFRWATPKSMAEGKWVHPGFKRGKGFMSSAIKKTREQTSEDIKQVAYKAFTNV